MNRSVCPYVLALLLSAATAVVAVAGVNVEIDANAKARGTLSVEGETNTFRFFATRGAELVLTVKAKGRKSDLDLALVLAGPDAQPIDLSAAPRFKDKGKAIQVKGLVLPATGNYALDVAAAGTGEYSLRLQAKPQKRFTETVPLGPGASTVLPYSAPPGSDVKVSAKAGGAADPRISEGPEKARVATLSLDDVVGGEASVVVTNDGETGSVQIVVTVKAPKSRPEKVDVRDRALGDADDGGTALSATVSAASGGSVTVDDDSGALLGAGVDVPPGSMAADARISVASALDISVPDPATQTAAGPAVAFGPEGLSFSTPASVTVPFDASLVPVGSDAGDVVQVVRRSADGTEEILDPTDVDAENGLVTAPTSGFSTFMAFVPRGTPRVDGRSFWMFSLRFHMQPDPLQQGSSTRRDLAMRYGTIDFGDEGTFTAFADERELAVDHSVDGTASQFSDFRASILDTGTFFYESSGQAIVVEDETGQGESVALSSDGRALAVVNRSTDEPTTELTVLLRRTAAATQQPLPVGTYTFAAVSARVETGPGPGGPAFLGREHELGTMVLRPDGRFTATSDAYRQEFDPAFANPVSRTERLGGAGTLTRDTAAPSHLSGSYLFTSDEGGRFRLLASESGDILIAFPDVDNTLDAGTAPFTAIIAVRQGTGLSEASLVGGYLIQSVSIRDLTSHLLPGGGAPRVADFIFSSEQTSVLFDGSRTARAGPAAVRVVERDDQDPSGVAFAIEFDETEQDVAFRLSSTGAFRTTDEAPSTRGGVTPRATFGVAVADPRGPDPWSGLSILLRLPPPTVLVEPDR